MAKVELPTNSSVPKATTDGKEGKKFEKVVTGKVTVKKKNELQKLADIFIAEDLQNVKRTLIYEMLIPAVRDLAVSMFNNTVNMVFYGKESRNRPYNGYYSNTQPPQPASWARYYSQQHTPPQNYQNNVYGQPSFQEATFNFRRDAEEVLDQMNYSISQYGRVSIADYYDLIGVSSDYTDFNYGWHDLRNANIRAVPGGFVISLPKAEILRR